MFSLFQLKNENSKIVILTIFILILIFTGLRFEIGYDWLSYEEFFKLVPSQINIDYYYNGYLNLEVEISYYILNNFIKTLGGNFESLLFIIALFNISVIHYAFKKIYNKSYAFSWLMYFTIALVPIQFNILRQSIAASFVILSLILILENKKLMSFVMFFIGCTFQISVLMLAVIVLTRNIIVTKSILIVFIAVCLLLFSLNLFIIDDSIYIVSNFLPGFFSDKAASYADSLASNDTGGASIFALLLVVLYFMLLYLFYPHRKEKIINVAFNITLLMIFCHLAFSQFPSIWNRTMAVSLVFQLPCAWSIINRHYKNFTLGVINFSITVSCIIVTQWQLSRPENIPFVPYHSLLQVWAFNDFGDGRARSIYAIRRSEELKAIGQ